MISGVFFMTMQLVGPYMTTTRYNRKQKQSKSKKLQQAHNEHEAWLKRMGVGKTNLPVDHKGNRTGIHDIPDYKVNQPAVKLSNKIAAHGPAKESNTYSGDRQLLGIATMHKSNMVPVFADKKDDAKDIANMRR
jgi:sortase (surface protein transpeptidase)